MKIALINEFSQASKNSIAYKSLLKSVSSSDHVIFNVGMENDDDYRLTYIHLGIMSSLLLNSGAVDFVVTGCGTGQGALMALNAFPGVTCGYCIDPSDAYLFLQVNNGNALSLPFAKGFGWGADINLEYIFEKSFISPTGMGYPPERKQSQNENAEILSQLKKSVSKDYIEGLKSIDEELLLHVLKSEKFYKCFNENATNDAIIDYVTKKLNK